MNLSNHAHKVLNWELMNTLKIVDFNRILSNPLRAHQFTAFKGKFLEKVDFWLTRRPPLINNSNLRANQRQLCMLLAITSTLFIRISVQDPLRKLDGRYIAILPQMFWFIESNGKGLRT